jgi:hypothetical protein
MWLSNQPPVADPQRGASKMRLAAGRVRRVRCGDGRCSHFENLKKSSAGFYKTLRCQANDSL